MIQLKRVYEPDSPQDGRRVLVERLWPRGIKKTALRLDDWIRDVAPSTPLRRWFSHDPAKWNEFQRRYSQELDQHSDAWQALVQAARRGRLTLLFSSKDVEHNNAVALKGYLEQRLHPKKNR
jgi:uncharacterized protein YeaO (DUF488 family)